MTINEYGLNDAARDAKVDAFLTVDDNLLKRARRYASQIGIKVTNPVEFLQEHHDEFDR